MHCTNVSAPIGALHSPTVRQASFSYRHPRDGYYRLVRVFEQFQDDCSYEGEDETMHATVSVPGVPGSSQTFAFASGKAPAL